MIIQMIIQFCKVKREAKYLPTFLQYSKKVGRYFAPRVTRERRRRVRPVSGGKETRGEGARRFGADALAER